jgi:hypothetical protein
MDRYNEKAHCSKCGCAFVSTSFAFGVMNRKCMRCGHSWEEAPLDQPVLSPDEKRWVEEFKAEGVVIVPAPGDACGGGGVIGQGVRSRSCPGCRACS